jgi:hypothetical protein
LKACSDAPISIIIIAIGMVDFSAMQYLDDVSIDSPDIVQFADFNRHKHDLNSLKAAIMSELTDQLLAACFQRNGIRPHASSVQIEKEDIVVDEAEDEIDLDIRL